jgi:uncharacterized protein DUF4476
MCFETIHANSILNSTIKTKNMKKIFTLLSSLALGIAVFAADAKPKNALTIKSVDRSNIKIVVDGRRFEPSHSSITIQGLDAGTHKVKIYKERNTGMFSIFGKKYDVVFNKSVNMKNRTDVTIAIDRFNRTTITTEKRNGRGGRDNDRWEDDDEFDFGNGHDYGDYNNDDRWNDRDDRYESGMNDRDFSRVLESIQKEWLESNKLKSATHIVTTNKLSTAQVRQMLILFSFESNKLQLAKSAYANTTDKRNYSMLYEVFSFSSSKDELARFIRNFR